VAFSEPKLTAAFSTPGVSARPFSMVTAQVVQVIPVMGMLALVVFSDPGLFDIYDSFAVRVWQYSGYYIWQCVTSIF
jgi:hypothetical protein